MTIQKFAPKDAETLKKEITTDLGIDYEDNQELVDKMVERELKGEQFKASLHEDKQKHLKAKEFYKQNLEKAGFDPKTGEKKSNNSKTETKENYSLQDIRALSDVHDEDVNEVVEYAKFKGISVAEAKNSTIIKNLLKEKNELRATAAATATGKAPRGTGKTSGESLLEKAQKGELPESEEDMQRLAEARIERMRKTNKN